MNCPAPECKTAASAPLGRKLSKVRPWIQTGFLAVWLAPVGQWLHAIPGCVFHCYSCPLSSFACPIGVAANYAALAPAAFEFPFLLVGVLLLVGAVAGSLVCGWACPFGFLQDLLAKVPVKKMALPGWMSYGRYVVLLGLVLLLPLAFGIKGIPYEEQVISICRLCPAGALEAGLPFSTQSMMAGTGWTMSWYKSLILVAFFSTAIFIHRPWCRVLCPLGGLLALFNRFSIFHLRFKSNACIECNLCRSRCSMGVKVDEKVNVSGCIRCLECTTCGAIEPCFAMPGKKQPPVAGK